jgi:hypothetical protein
MLYIPACLRRPASADLAPPVSNAILHHSTIEEYYYDKYTLI